MTNPISPNVNPNFNLEQSDVRDPSTVQGKAFAEKLDKEKEGEMQSKPSLMDTAKQSAASGDFSVAELKEKLDKKTEEIEDKISDMTQTTEMNPATRPTFEPPY